MRPPPAPRPTLDEVDPGAVVVVPGAVVVVAPGTVVVVSAGVGGAAE